MAEKLTPAQVDECKEIFDLFDADEDGKSPSATPSDCSEPQLTCPLLAGFLLLRPVAAGRRAGRIATGELVTALRSLGQNVDEAEARRFLEDAGVVPSGAGTIDLAAFLAVAARKMGARQTEARLAECFDVFDDARSGSIPSEQLRQVMLTHGDRLTDEEADAMLREADPAAEGRVEYKQYVKVLLRDKK